MITQLSTGWSVAWLGIGVGLGLTCTTPSVAAETPDPASRPAPPDGNPSPTPKVHFVVPQPQPPVVRSFHVHDGFYLRLNAGIGFVGADFSNGGTENDDLSADGSDLALDVLVGGSPSRGVAVGGALLSNTLLAADLEQSGDTVTDRDISIVLLGPFIDGFPNAKRGWHLGGTIGLSAVKQKDLGEFGQTDRTVGLGAAAWAGYDAWVGDEWSLGGQLRFMLTRTRDGGADPEVAASTRSITLMFTALYH